MRACWLIVLVGMGAVFSRAEVGEWKVYTSKRSVRALTSVRGTVWAVTSGGMFSYRTSDGSFSQYTTAEGLKSIDLTAVAADSAGALWIGASNGLLQRYNPGKNLWQYVSDIEIRSDPQKSINALLLSGDTLYILSDIGVSLFSVSRLEFLSTFGRFGPQPMPIVGQATALVMFQGKYWVATRSGIASTSLSNPNPSLPESWQVMGTAQGLPSAAVSCLGFHQGKLVAGTMAGLAVWNGTAWAGVPGTQGQSVNGFFPGDTSYFIAGTSLVGLRPDWGTFVAASFPSVLTGISGPVLGTLDAGLFVYSDSGYVQRVPPGPASNLFVSIALDANGGVWAATGSRNGAGFMSFTGGAWHSYTLGTDSSLGINNYYKMSMGASGAMWASCWGAGVALIDQTGTVRRVLSTKNGLPPTSGDDPFVVVGGVAADNEGVTWITNRTGRGDTALVKFGADSSLSYVTGFDTRDQNIIFTDVVIDQNDTKWFANYGRFEPSTSIAHGLYFYNSGLAITGGSPGWGRLTQDDGLTSDKVWCLAVDLTGALWVGSDQGITIIFDPMNPRAHVAAYHPLRDQLIQGIAVDPLNNKWVATKQGVFLMSPDGTSILESHTAETTAGKLLDDDVASVAIDKNTGVVYFGTEKGLTSLSTAAIEPTVGMNELVISPNPFTLPSSQPLTVEGLSAGSVLKILSTDGSLVRELTTPGGRVGFWDGRNNHGDLVATSVYIVVAYSADGSIVATGKVAVIRR